MKGPSTVTTILITEEWVAWDSAMRFGAEQHSTPDPKVIVRPDGVWAAAGSSDLADRVVVCLSEGQCITSIPGYFEQMNMGNSGGFEVVRLKWDKAGRLVVRYWSDSTLFGFTPPLPLALGSGSSFVLGAYYGSGGDAVKAVELAAQHDGWSGGMVHSKSTKDLKKSVEAKGTKRAVRKR
jgi:hypothetical protein